MAGIEFGPYFDLEAYEKAQKAKASNPSASVDFSRSGSELGKDAFLKLLLTQLQYQDPLDPMDNTQFVAQMAQFTALEQMQNLNSTMTNSQAYSMIGRTVYANTFDETTGKYTEILGTVDSVNLKSGVPYLVVGDKEFSYSDVQQVYSAGSTTNIDKNIVVSQALGLVGKSIQAIKVDDNLNAQEFIEGKVDYVKFIDDTPVLSVNGKDIYTNEVVSVSDNTLLKGQKLSANVYDTDAKNNIDITGTINGVEIKDESIYLNIDKYKVEITDIASILNAISYIGKDASYGKISGKVDSVIIRDKEPYLVIGDDEIKYSFIS